MLVFSLEHIHRFLLASSLLSKLGEEAAHLKFCESTFDFTVRSKTDSHHFFVILRIKPPFFSFYQPSISPLFFDFWRIDLKEFCNHLRRGIDSCSMDFSLSDDNLSLATLTFHDSAGTSEHVKPSFCRQMMLSHPINEDDIYDINYATFVSIDSEQFKRIVIKFRNIDTVNVTMSNLQVTFSSEYKKITLNKEYGECIIGGVEEDDEIDFGITLRPTTFFNDLTFLAKRVWFYQTNESDIVLYAPIDLNAAFEIYFITLM